MNITLRKGQKVDVMVPVNRFPTFTNKITLLGQNIPTGVYLSFAALTTSPSVGETVKFTVETTANYNGGTFLITGNPAPSSPLEVVMEVNNSIEQYDITVRLKRESNSGAGVSGFTYQVLDPLTGSIITQSSSNGSEDFVRFYIPTNYSRVIFIASKTGYTSTNHVINLSPITKVMTVDVPIAQKFNVVNLTTVIQTDAYLNVGAGTTDTITVKSALTGEILYSKLVDVTLQNPITRKAAINLPPTANFPYDLVVSIQRTGYNPYLANVKFTAINTEQSLSVYLSKVSESSGSSNLQVNYISAYSVNSVSHFDLYVTGAGVNTKITPSNYTGFSYTNIVPQDWSTDYHAGKAIVPKLSSYTFYNPDLTSMGIASAGSVSYVPKSISQTRAAAMTFGYEDYNMNPPARTKLVVGRRLLLSYSSLVENLQTIRAYSDPECTNLIYSEPIEHAVPVEVDKIYVRISVLGRSSNSTHLNSIVREVDLSQHKEGSYIDISYINVPPPSTNYLYIDMNNVSIATRDMFNFDAVSSPMLINKEKDPGGYYLDGGLSAYD